MLTNHPLLPTIRCCPAVRRLLSSLLPLLSDNWGLLKTLLLPPIFNCRRFWWCSPPLTPKLIELLKLVIAFSFVAYPSLILAYMGQAAYLSKHHIIESDYRIRFYASVPEKLCWPVLAIAILAAVVGSQAIITGTFLIIKQCSALGCFPSVKIIHTLSKICRQIYIPEINWTLMLLYFAVTVGFRDVKHISNTSEIH